MKRTIQAAVVVLLLVAAGVAAAADTAPVTVTARVLGTCRFSAGGTTLPFGDLPFDAAGNPAAGGATATATLQFWCTNGASYAITDDSGLHATAPGARRMQSTTLATPEYIAYGMSYNPATGTGTGPGNPVTLTINGTVGPVYGANSPDSYADTVTLSINP